MAARRINANGCLRIHIRELNGELPAFPKTQAQRRPPGPGRHRYRLQGFVLFGLSLSLGRLLKERTQDGLGFSAEALEEQILPNGRPGSFPRIIRELLHVIRSSSRTSEVDLSHYGSISCCARRLGSGGLRMRSSSHPNVAAQRPPQGPACHAR